MKIGILTHHYINNFGAFLQGYALREAVAELFPEDDVYIIDLINYKHFIINTGGWFRFYKDRENVRIWLQKIQLPLTFLKVRQKYLKLTTRCSNVQQLNRLELDCIIVGSDEVWNYRDKKSYSPVKFGLGIDVKKLIAYAPSVGQSTVEDVPGNILNGIKKYDAVSARDDLTEQFIEKIRKEKVCRVTDPTFLADIPDEVVPGINRPYILFYYCDGLDAVEKNKIINYARENNMDVYGAGETDKRYTMPTVNLTPFQWVWMFRNAAYVITGTFHGTVFSILNHQKFACYMTNASRIKKVTSLLQEYNLTDHQCKGTAEELLEAMTKDIDYKSIQKKINREKEKSLEFLEKAIGNRE